MDDVYLWGVPELAKWGLLPSNDPRVIAITKRWMEARSKNARWCEAVNAKDAEIERLKEHIKLYEQDHIAIERFTEPVAWDDDAVACVCRTFGHGPWALDMDDPREICAAAVRTAIDFLGNQRKGE